MEAHSCKQKSQENGETCEEVENCKKLKPSVTSVLGGVDNSKCAPKISVFSTFYLLKFAKYLW